MNTKILEDIGLTNAEIKVYIALLELGTATAGPILEKTGLQSSVVHMTLNKLIEKGFVSFVKEGRKKQYSATNPRNIIEFIEEKKEKFENILPQLLLKQESSKEKSEVETFRGIRGIKQLLIELLNADGKEHHTFGSAKESLMLGDEWWVSYHKKRANKGVTAKLLFNQSLAYWKAEHKYPNSEVRYTAQGFEPLTETIIRADKVGIILWIEKPIGILVTNKVLAKSYDCFWKVLWKSSKK